MRFARNFINIPDVLIDAQERGELLFVCGAGVSRTEGLPSFADLVKGVYRDLGDSWLEHPAEAMVMEEGGALEGQFDRALRALERRLGTDNRRGAGVLRGRIRDAIDRQLVIEDNAVLPNHLALLELSRGPDNSVRLLTTNFDCGFELAWKHLPTQPLSHAGASMPKPGSYNFEGVLHLHGRMGAAGLPATDYVLTSAEFGDAYLRSGWATRYVYDLARAHTLVLVGYAANDPPMRYLLEVLEDDRGRYPDMRKVHSFAAARLGKKAEEEALWRAKGIEPHLYEAADNGAHELFYATLRAWRDYSVAPVKWRSERLATLFKESKDQVDPDDGEAITYLLAKASPIEVHRLKPPPEWWPVISGNPKLSASALGAWIASQADQPSMLTACIGKPPRDPEAFQQVLQLVSWNDKSLPEHLARGWRLLAVAKKAADDRLSGTAAWPAIQLRLMESRASKSDLSDAINLLRPSISLYSPAWQDGLVDEAPRSLDRLMDVEFTTIGSPTSREILAAVPETSEVELSVLVIADRVLEDSLDQAYDAGYLEPLDKVSLSIRSLGEPEGPFYQDGFAPLINLIVGLWTRVVRKDGSIGRDIALSWRVSSYPFRQRLVMYALGFPNAFSATEVFDQLMRAGEKTFWSDILRTEVVPTLRSRWSDFGKGARRKLESRLFAGPPSFILEGILDKKAAHDWMIITRLHEIRRGGGALSFKANSRLEKLILRSPYSFQSVSEKEITQQPMVMFPEAEFELTEPVNLDKAALLRRLAAVDRQDQAFQSRLVELLSIAGPDLDSGISILLLELSLQAWKPQICGACVQWLWRRGRETETMPSLPNRFLDVWDHAASAILEGDELPLDLPLSVDRALNSTGGVLALALFTFVAKLQWTQGQGFGEDLRARLNRITRSSHTAAISAQLILVRELAALHTVDPDWTEEAFVTKLNARTPEAFAFWVARAGRQVGSPRLFSLLKPGFKAAISFSSDRVSGASGLAFNLVQVAVWRTSSSASDYDLQPDEAKRLLAASPVVFRRETALVFWRSIASPEALPESRARRWSDLVGPAFHYIWPLDLSAQDPEVSQRLIWMAVSCDYEFPDALNKIITRLTSFRIYSVKQCFILDGLGCDIPVRFPDQFLALLDRALGPRPTVVPVDLSSILSSLDLKLSNNADRAAFNRLAHLIRCM